MQAFDHWRLLNANQRNGRRYSPHIAESIISVYNSYKLLLLQQFIASAIHAVAGCTGFMMSIAEAMPEPTSTEKLFRLYHRELSNFAFQRLRDRECAADVVQDAFVRYLDLPINSVGTPVQPRFFLWRIVGNLTIDVLRQRRRRPQVSIDHIADNVCDPALPADVALSSRQQLALLKRALNEMPDSWRSALLLNRLCGLTHRQIGQRMGVSQSMVSKYIMAALRYCHSRLNPISTD